MGVKKLGVMLWAVVFLLVLGACSSKSAEADTQKKSIEEQGRIYKSVKGDIELPTNPKRIVVADQDYVGHVLALGITPVGAAGWVFDVPYYEKQLKGVEKVGDKAGISLETITSLHPDVILTYSEENYERLSKIAPTVVIPFGKYNFRDELIEIGKVLNREKEAKEWIAKLDKKVEDKKQELFQQIDKDTKVAIVELAEKEIYVFGSTYGRGGEILYNELGLPAPSKVEKAVTKEGWGSLSYEAIPEYLGEADYIYLGVRGESVGYQGGEASKAELESMKIWQDLPAVKAGHVTEYDVETFYFKDPIALDNQLDDITKQLMSK